jgi:uncharacterized membrane protein
LIKLALTALPLLTIVIRRIKRQIIAYALAAFLACAAIFWGSVAGFLALVPLWGAPAAAGAVAGTYFLIALIVLLIGRSRPRATMGMPLASTASMAATTGAVAGASSPTLMAALLAGYMAGRGK